MSKNKKSDTLELVSEERALAFCAQLNSQERRVVAYCIDGEISALGLPDGTRAGSNTFQEARRKAVTEIQRREVNLEELGMEALFAISEGLDDGDEKVRDICKKTKARIDRYAEFLEEEAKERSTASTTQEEWDEVA